MAPKYPLSRSKVPATKAAGKSSGVNERDVIRLRNRLAAIRYQDGMTVEAFIATNSDRMVALRLLYRDHKAGRIIFEGRP
ncbi:MULTISPECIES: hypothetical protein [unclassified Phyllobacterium]|uniref:hypothetical protein n=1 Tax=unclassified Phyllobacterium TaxID=2638441 RepID=UPI0030130417